MYITLIVFVVTSFSIVDIEHSKTISTGYAGTYENCVVSATPLIIGSKIHLVSTDMSNEHEKVTIMAEVQDCPIDMYTNDVMKEDNNTYKYKISETRKMSSRYKFFVLDGFADFSVRGVDFDINKDGINDGKRVCYEHEAWIFSLWDKEPLSSKKLMSVYSVPDFNLPEDAQPMCNDKDRN